MRQILIVMKLTICILFLTTLQISAEIYSQNIQLALTSQSGTLADIIEAIEHQSEYKVFYKTNQIDVNKKVSISEKNKTLVSVLNKAIEGSDITYYIMDKLIVLTTSKNRVQQQKITGTVIDANTGDVLPGVTILIEGSTTGTASDLGGRFSIEVPNQNTILVFSFMGYLSERITLSGQATLDIKLMPDIKQLSEIVVVGYGTQKKRDVTSAVASFKADNLEERPLTRVDQALVGQMAGVQVKQTTGSLGKPFSIQIRGTGSISAGTEPLYVIDGFPLATANQNASGNFASGNPMDNLNPNDIESIQVLKDAAAAAIYGSRAANGVVIISTKQGKTGKPKISFNSYIGYTQASRKLDMLSAEEWTDRAKEIINAQWEASGTGRTASQTTEERRMILGLSPGQVNTNYMIDDRWDMEGHPGLRYIDWQDEIFRKGIVQDYQLSAYGGTESVKYYVSGNFSKQQGMVIGTDYTSFSARANVEITANKNLKFGINLTPSYSITNDPGVEGKDNILHQAISLTPVQEDSMGLYANTGNFGQYKWSAATNSPVAKLQNTIGETRKFRTLTSIFAEYQIMKGLIFKATVNLDNTDNVYNSYVPYTVTSSLSARQAQLSTLTSGSSTGYKKQTFVNENTLTYNTLIAAKHDLSFLAGTSYNFDRLDESKMNSKGGFNNSTVTTLNEATAVTGSTTEAKNVLLSYFGRIQYSFDGKYLLSASLRGDGSSRFGSNTQWGTFPSASLGWRVSEEKFMKNTSSISDLKIRASWGKSGNYNIGDYSSIPILTTTNYTFNSVQATGQAPKGITNPNLTWEKSETFDVGIDIGIFKNRITASFDIYTKLNTGLLFNVPLLQVTGFNSYLSNAAKIKNKGWELELTSRNITGRFQWITTANLSHNSNKVVSISGGQTQLLRPSLFDISHSILKVGEQLNSFYVVRQIGILTQEDIDNHAALYGPETVGDPKYLDANTDGVIDANDRVIVGHPNPSYVWGVTNTFKFKGFDLSILVQGQNGGSIYSLLGRAINRTGQNFNDNALGIHRDRWRSAENPGEGKIGKAYSTFGRIKNTDWLYSSDYWRIRNITLGYNLGKLIRAKQIQGARIYITAENWFGADKYTGGFNPEAANTDVSGNTSFPETGDYGGLPIAKSLILGVNLTF